MANVKSFRLGAVAIALAAATAGCGGTTSSDSPSAQPTPNVTTFEPGRFDDLPRFPRREPLGPKNGSYG